jgi:putative endonuclease
MGELAARRFLEKQGLRFLVANFRSKRGEIDLVFQSEHGLVFVEVKTREVNGWTRPAAAVNRAKRRCLTRAALDYLRALRNPKVLFRFDIVEVLLENDQIVDLQHIPNAFTLSKPYRYG